MKSNQLYTAISINVVVTKTRLDPTRPQSNIVNIIGDELLLNFGAKFQR